MQRVRISVYSVLICHTKNRTLQKCKLTTKNCFNLIYQKNNTWPLSDILSRHLTELRDIKAVICIHTIKKIGRGDRKIRVNNERGGGGRGGEGFRIYMLLIWRRRRAVTLTTFSSYSGRPRQDKRAPLGKPQKNNLNGSVINNYSLLFVPFPSSFSSLSSLFPILSYKFFPVFHF